MNYQPEIKMEKEKSSVWEKVGLFIKNDRV